MDERRDDSDHCDANDDPHNHKTLVSGSGGSVSVVTTTSAGPSTTIGAPFADAVQIMMAAGVALIAAVYPTLVLIFMTRPRIREAFNATGAFD